MEMNDNYKINFPQSVSTSIQAREEWDKMLKESNPFDTLSNYVKDIIERKDKETAFGFIKCIGKLLRKNGVVPLIEKYATGEIVKDDSTIEQKYRVAFTGLDFTEHDKKFNDEIESLKRQIEKLASIRTRCHESARDCFDSGNYGCLHIVTADELKTTRDKNDRTVELPFDPLETANMLINATYKAEIPFLEKQVKRNVYDIDDLEQIAEHLLVYCKHNRESE